MFSNFFWEFHNFFIFFFKHEKNKGKFFTVCNCSDFLMIEGILIFYWHCNSKTKIILASKSIFFNVRSKDCAIGCIVILFVFRWKKMKRSLIYLYQKRKIKKRRITFCIYLFKGERKKESKECNQSNNSKNSENTNYDFMWIFVFRHFFFFLFFQFIILQQLDKKLLNVLLFQIFPFSISQLNNYGKNSNGLKNIQFSNSVFQSILLNAVLQYFFHN